MIDEYIRLHTLAFYGAKKSAEGDARLNEIERMETGRYNKGQEIILPDWFYGRNGGIPGFIHRVNAAVEGPKKIMDAAKTPEKPKEQFYSVRLPNLMYVKDYTTKTEGPMDTAGRYILAVAQEIAKKTNGLVIAR